MMRRERPSHVISLLSPEEIHLAPDGHAPERHLRLAMHDVRGEALARHEIPPAADQVAQILSFAETWPGDEPILVHCWAGISRSTATAFCLACARNPDADETAIAQALRAASPTAWPNPVIIGYADAALGRAGRMIAAVEAIGEPDHFDTEPFHIPAAFTLKAD